VFEGLFLVEGVELWEQEEIMFKGIFDTYSLGWVYLEHLGQQIPGLVRYFSLF